MKPLIQRACSDFSKQPSITQKPGQTREQEHTRPPPRCLAGRPAWGAHSLSLVVSSEAGAQGNLCRC